MKTFQKVDNFPTNPSESAQFGDLIQHTSIDQIHIIHFN